MNLESRELALDKLRTREQRAFREEETNLDARYVPGIGSFEPIAFIMGEAPGAREAMARQPFVGPSGAVLVSLMSLAGLYAYHSAEQPNCWLTNTVKFRPPNNRNPTSHEIDLARYFLRKEWILVGRPRVIVPVGGIALCALFGRPLSVLRYAGEHMKIARAHGRMHVFPMLHPAYGLRNESAREPMENHWSALGDFLANHP